MSIGSGLGGIEKSMINFLQYLSSSMAFQIDLYLWREPGSSYDQIAQDINILNEDVAPLGIRECKSFIDYISYFTFRFFDLFSMGTKVLKKIDREYDIAIAYCQVGHTPYYVIDKVSAKKKYLFYHHGSYDVNWLRHLVDKKYYGSYDAIITMSDANAKMMKRYFPKYQTKIFSSSPFLNGDKIIEKSKDVIFAQQHMEIIPTLVTVARLSPEKGIKEAIDAAKILNEKGFNFKWIFVGSSYNKQAYQNYIDRLNLRDICILVGSKENPYPFMALATIYVQPSIVESFCITIREAAILNKPIIASNIPAIYEACNEIDNLLLTSYAPECMSKSIGEILLDYDGLKKGIYNTSLKADVNSKSVVFFNYLLNINTTSNIGKNNARD